MIEVWNFEVSVLKSNLIGEPWVHVNLPDDSHHCGAIPKVMPLTIGDPAIGVGSLLRMKDQVEQEDMGRNLQHENLSAKTLRSERGSVPRRIDQIDDNLRLHRESGLDGCELKHLSDQQSQSPHGQGTPGQVTPYTSRQEEDLKWLQQLALREKTEIPS